MKWFEVEIYIGAKEVMGQKCWMSGRRDRRRFDERYDESQGENENLDEAKVRG